MDEVNDPLRMFDAKFVIGRDEVGTVAVFKRRDRTGYDTGSVRRHIRDRSASTFNGAASEFERAIRISTVRKRAAVRAECIGADDVGSCAKIVFVDVLQDFSIAFIHQCIG